MLTFATFATIDGVTSPCETPKSRALLATVRAVLDEHGLRESVFGVQSGFILEIEKTGEASVEFSDTTEVSACAPGSAATVDVTTRLSRCCAAFVATGLSVTLVASPRVLALYVRSTSWAGSRPRPSIRLRLLSFASVTSIEVAHDRSSFLPSTNAPIYCRGR